MQRLIGAIALAMIVTAAPASDRALKEQVDKARAAWDECLGERAHYYGRRSNLPPSELVPVIITACDWRVFQHLDGLDSLDSRLDPNRVLIDFKSTLDRRIPELSRIVVDQQISKVCG